MGNLLSVIAIGLLGAVLISLLTLNHYESDDDIYDDDYDE